MAHCETSPDGLSSVTRIDEGVHSNRLPEEPRLTGRLAGGSKKNLSKRAQGGSAEALGCGYSGRSSRRLNSAQINSLMASGVL